ncbi:MAG: hypothetical protein EOO89_19970 [Pedobacter sp.]|nr:MAG: hypothetical protein EOO89_19970 [Pedobacter sp.]
MDQQYMQFIIIYGSVAIFGLIYLIEIGIPLPIPNEMVLISCGYLVHQGWLELYLILPIAIIADFLGSATLFSIFYFIGAYLVLHKPKWFPLSDATIFSMVKKIKHVTWQKLLFFRMAPFIRGYASVGSGIAKLKPCFYLRISFCSSVIVCVTYILIGLMIAPLWRKYEPLIIKYMNNLIVLTLLITCVFFIDKYVSQRVRKKFTKGKHNYLNTRQITVHMISETEFATKGQGVHTAYVEMMQLLKGIENLTPVKNGDGHGNIYHSHTYGPYYFWKGLGYKGRRILTAHVIPSSSKGAIPFWKFLMPLTQKYLKLAYSYADVIVAISPAVEQEILDLGVKTKIVRIYNPVIKDNWLRTVERREEGRAYLNIDTDQKLVLGVGQLQERKGVEDFIDSLTKTMV